MKLVGYCVACGQIVTDEMAYVQCSDEVMHKRCEKELEEEREYRFEELNFDS